MPPDGDGKFDDTDVRQRYPLFKVGASVFTLTGEEIYVTEDMKLLLGEANNSLAKRP